MTDKPTVLLIRSDLRLNDHVALNKAAEAGPVVPVFVLDEQSEGDWPIGAASRWWLHHSLAALGQAFQKRGVELVLRRGDTVGIVADLASQVGAGAVHMTRHYEPSAAGLEKKLKATLEERDIPLRRYGGHLLVEPEDIATQNGDPYKVYTPFWRALSRSIVIRDHLPAPDKITPSSGKVSSDSLDDFGLLPSRPNWAKGWEKEWSPGEAGARGALENFLEDALDGYGKNRDRPDMKGTSRLSPHLHFGEIAPHAVWRAVASRSPDKATLDGDKETFLKELVWREFSAHLLFHFPTLPDEAFKAEFATYPWKMDTDQLVAWQKGQTGYPIVDAGMRQLWQTGWMHNRVRMVVASFLIKHLLIPWQRGEAWFWDTLVDADLANNAASWQWVAGSGADAAPYFRIFNPMSQGEKFDPDGDYVRRWVPELKDLPSKAIHAPFTAPREVLEGAGVVLGKTYPKPIVVHADARERALAGYEAIRR